MKDLVLVIPCYNEKKRLDPEVFLRFVADHDGVELVFVNDGSTDETLAVLQRLHDASPDRTHVIDQPENRGKADAVRAGMLYGADEGAGLVGYWDADLSTPLDAVPELLSILKASPEIEMVFGARVKLLGRHIDRHRWRHYLGRVFATAVSMMLDLAIYDTQCGAKIFRNTDRLRDAFATPFVSPWLFDVEVIARLKGSYHANARPFEATVYEFPLTEWRDVPGSKLTGAAYVRASAGIVRIYWTYRGLLDDKPRSQ